MRKLLTGKIDYLKDSTITILLVLSVPLLLAAAVSFAAQLLNNRILRTFAGEEIFTVLGSISLFTTCLTSFCCAVRSAAWVRTAKEYRSAETASRAAVQSAYAIILFDLFCGLMMMFLSKPILTALNVNPAIFRKVRRYFSAYCISLFAVDVSQYFLTVITGTVSSVGILLMSILNTLIPAGMSLLLVGVLEMNEVGVGLTSSAAGLLVTVCFLIYLRRTKVLARPKRKDFIPDFRKIGTIIGYGLIRSLQSVLVTSGEILVLRNTNLLDPDYITCLSVSLPINAVLGPLGTSVSLFVPINYQSGNEQRVKEFLRTNLTVSAALGILCAVCYIFVARPYFSALFPGNPRVVEYGVIYWRYWGLSQFFLVILTAMLNFYEAIGYNWFYMLEGVFEVSGKLICALFLIPAFGVFGRNMSYMLGWILGNAELLGGYLLLRKRIYTNCRENLPAKEEAR